VTEYQLAVTSVVKGQASYRVYMTESGIDRTYIGPTLKMKLKALHFRLTLGLG
jgi:hypothetical protein